MLSITIGKLLWIYYEDILGMSLSSLANLFISAIISHPGGVLIFPFLHLKKRRLVLYFDLSIILSPAP
jgi:hypothetical protein